MNFLKHREAKWGIGGFLFGAVILPFIAVLGLGIPFLGYAKVLLSPGIFMSQPFIVHLNETTSYVSSFGWMVFSMVNGLFYAGLFVLFVFISRRNENDN